MDAWLPEYDAERRGTSLVILRSEKLASVLTNSSTRGNVTASESLRKKSHKVRANSWIDGETSWRPVATSRRKHSDMRRGSDCRSVRHIAGKHNKARATADLALCRDMRDELLRYRKRLCDARLAGAVARLAILLAGVGDCPAMAFSAGRFARQNISSRS